jgi:pantothenate kinase
MGMSNHDLRVIKSLTEQIGSLKRKNASLKANLVKSCGLQVTWEADVAARIRKDLSSRLSSKPYMVGIVGIPGSGKSTSADILLSMLEGAISLPMDGYHLYLAELKAAAHPEDMVYRRGAPDTFDPISLKRDLVRIVDGDEMTVKLPGFDHARGDPEPDLYAFHRKQHNVVIMEGKAHAFHSCALS